MESSIFMDKSVMPSDTGLKQAIGETYSLWKQIRDHVYDQYPAAAEEWNFPGKKYGWSFRIKDKKRAIIYLLPQDGYFKVAFVFGGKATSAVLDSRISEEIQTELRNAKAYAEGRGIRIAVKDAGVLKDVEELIRIKLAY